MNREMIVPFPTPDGPQMTKGFIGKQHSLLSPKEDDDKERTRSEEPVMGRHDLFCNSMKAPQVLWADIAKNIQRLILILSAQSFPPVEQKKVANQSALKYARVVFFDL